MRSQAARISLSLVCLLFGILLMVQFRTQGKIAKTVQAESSGDQAQIISNLYDANLTLRQEVASLEKQVRDQQQAHGGDHLSEVAGELQKFRIVNGTVSATGPGVELTVEADIRPEDVQDLINEFRNAGAEAMSINNLRITSRTAVTSNQGVVLVNDHRLASPYVFQAIGASDILDRALTRKGGLVGYLQNTYPEGRISVQKKEKLSLPAAADSAAFRLARPEPAGAANG